GVCGGVFVGVIAPRVFHSFSELPLGALLFFLLLLVTLLTAQRRQTRRDRYIHGLIVALYSVAVVGGLLYVFWASEDDDTIIARSRNFYGVLTVTEDEPEEQPDGPVRFL